MKKRGIIIALILMSIGFAAVATTLTITGTIKYGYDNDDFDVIFSEAILDGVVKGEDLIEPTDKKSITFETKDLSTLGDKSILEYQVMNNSKQYDATVAIKCERVDDDGNISDIQTSEYTEIKPSPKTLTVKAQESRKGTITVELKKVSTTELEEKFKCSLTVNPSEREEEPVEYIADTSCKSVATPNLGDGTKLIPVTIDENGNVTKVSKANEDWYDYCTKKWANAVILKESPLKTYGENEQISMDDIEAMFVWIPKYKYRLWNVNVTEPLYNAHSIEIVFDKTNTEDVEGVSCKSPMNDDNTQGLSGNTGSCNNGEYMTHPAFISFGVDGFWVGKFETGYKDADTSTHAEQFLNDDQKKIIIKPNVYSWRSNTVKNIFNASKNYESTLNSHMMKNTEWGAVAYLSHSIFGINKEITINNNSQYKTGYAALPTTDQSKYPGENGDGSEYNTLWNKESGSTASTTGNITGIYDMSGGSWEYMAAYIESNLGSSGFNYESDGMDTLKKYFDVYKSDSNDTSYSNMILGDATGEMGPFSYYADSNNIKNWHNSWYADVSGFADSSNPWFHRGGAYSGGFTSGIFFFHRNNGASAGGLSFRIVLSPAN